MEVEVLLASYIQADYEVREREAWRWWICRREEVYIGGLRYGRRSS